jgi:hypothetical protein
VTPAVPSKSTCLQHETLTAYSYNVYLKQLKHLKYIFATMQHPDKNTCNMHLDGWCGKLCGRWDESTGGHNESERAGDVVVLPVVELDEPGVRRIP